VQEKISSVQEENHTQKKIITSNRRLRTCSRRIISFIKEDILLSLHLLLQKISFLGAYFNIPSDMVGFDRFRFPYSCLVTVLSHQVENLNFGFSISLSYSLAPITNARKLIVMGVFGVRLT
jgi:hypothetical protein